MSSLMKLLKSIFFILAIFVFFLGTLPKENLYFKLEELLSKYDIVVYDESLNSSLNSLEIKNGIINYKQIDGAFFQDIKFTLNGFSNSLSIKNLKVNQSLKNFIPADINSMKISHSIFNPIYIDIVANSKIGDFIGYVQLLENRVYIEFNARKNLSSKESTFLKTLNFKKKSNSNKGVYVYEYKY